MIQNIVWNIDGTLFETYPAITYALSRSLNRLGMPVALNTIDGLVRQSFDLCLVTLSRRYKVDADALQKFFDEEYQILPPENQLPVAGAGEVCRFIQDQGGRNLALYDHNGECARRLLAVHGFAPFFVDGIHAGGGSSPGAAALHLETAVNRLGLERKETLAVCDGDFNLRVGRAAGLQTCCIGQASIAEPADLYFKDYSQLLAFLKEQDGSCSRQAAGISPS